MARINEQSKEILATLILAGPHQSGKSSLLRTIRSRVQPGRIRAVPGADDQANNPAKALIDWLPLNLGQISGWNVMVDLYAVSGSHTYDNTRRILLNDADGLLMVLDSQASRLDDNLSALRELQDELLNRDGDLRDLPRVFCYTKQDLPEELIFSPEVLDEALNFRGAPSSGAEVLRGKGVLESLHALVTLMMRRMAPSPRAAE